VARLERRRDRVIDFGLCAKQTGQHAAMGRDGPQEDRKAVGLLALGRSPAGEAVDPRPVHATQKDIARQKQARIVQHPHAPAHQRTVKPPGQLDVSGLQAVEIGQHIGGTGKEPAAEQALP
jgi:hypothetical protein